MTSPNIPYLCGGIIFDLLLEARKPRQKVRDKYKGGSDGLSDPDVMEKFIYIITGENTDISGGTLKKCTSEYKSCQISDNTYIPFNEISTITPFDKAVKNKNPDLLKRMSEFINRFINLNKAEWLVKALIEVIVNDAEIAPTDEFTISRVNRANPSELKNITKIELQPFLLSVLHYIILNRQDNKKGRATFEAWFSRSTERAKWKFNSDVGQTITQSIKVDYIDISEETFAEKEAETIGKEDDTYPTLQKLMNNNPNTVNNSSATTTETGPRFCFSISFAEESIIELDVTSEKGSAKVFNTNYTDCIADKFSTETKNQIMKWFVSGKSDAFIVVLNDRRTDYVKPQYADLEAKIDAGVELTIEEQVRYNNLGLLIKRFDRERRVKEKAITVYLKDKLFHAYSHADFYTYLLDFIKDILNFPYRRGISQDAEYRNIFTSFDVYTKTVPKEYFVVDLLKSDVEETLKKVPLLQFSGSFVCDWGLDMAKKIAVQYYVQYIGRQIIDHERPILESDEYLNFSKASIHNWLTGPH